MTEELIETSHVPSTAQAIIESDLPYWHDAAVHAIEVYNRYAAKVGKPPFAMPKPKADA